MTVLITLFASAVGKMSILRMCRYAEKSSRVGKSFGG